MRSCCRGSDSPAWIHAENLTVAVLCVRVVFVDMPPMFRPTVLGLC